MNRTAKQFSIFLGLLALIFGVRYLINSIDPWAKASLLSELNLRGILADVDKVVVSLPTSAHIKRLGMFIPISAKLPLPMMIDTAQVKTSLLKQLIGANEFELNATLYDGSLEIKQEERDGVLEADLSLDQLALGQHPWIAVMGVTGRLNANLSFVVQEDSDYPADGDFRLLARQISYAGGHRVAGVLELPPIADGEIEIEGELARNSVVFKTISSTSSLGRITGSGRLVYTESTYPSGGTLTLRVELSESATQIFGGYLALAAQIPDAEPSPNWNIVVVFSSTGQARATVHKVQ